MSTQILRLPLLFLSAIFLVACQTQMSSSTQQLPTETILAPSPTVSPIVPVRATITPQPTEEPRQPSPWPTPTAGPTPAGGSEQIMFSIALRKGESYQSQGVFYYNFFLKHVDQIFDEGYSLQATSPDGRWILVNRGAGLFLAGFFGSNPQQLSSDFYDQSLSPAIWSDDGSQIYWVENVNGNTRVMQSDFLGREIALSTGELQEQTVELLWADREGQFGWLQGTCNAGSLCRGVVRTSDENVQAYSSLDGIANPIFNSSHSLLAFTKQASEGVILGIKDSMNGKSSEVFLDGDIPVDYTWSVDGQSLAVIAQIRSEYSGHNLGNHLLILEGPDWKPAIVAEFEGASAHLIWSPDGKQIFLSSTIAADDGYRIQLMIFEPATKKLEIVDIPMETLSAAYVFVPRLFWVRVVSNGK